MRVNTLWSLAAFGVFLLATFLGLIPRWSMPLATIAMFLAVSAIGLNLVFGVAGMLAFGQAVFSGLPGYFAAFLARLGVPLALAFGVAVIGAGALAFIFAAIFIRLPGAYFAIGTICLAFVTEGLLRAFPAITGGASGLVIAHQLHLSDLGWYALAALLFLTCSLIYSLIVRGRLHRALVAIRQDELSSAVLGINVARMKTFALTVGGLLSAVGGLALAQYAGVSVPESTGVNRSLEQIAVVIIGGAGLPLGPILGATLTEWLLSLAGEVQRFEILLYGGLFLLTVLFAPTGVAGLVRNYAVAWFGPKGNAAGPQRVDRAAPAPPVAIVEKRRRPTGPCLRVEQISKRFGGLEAVSNVTIEVAHGSIVALIGPNGAGKSTLFNIVSGVERASSGRILIHDHDISDAPIHERARYIGRSFQVPRLTASLTVMENILIRLDQIEGTGSERERRAAASMQLARFGLDALLDTPAANLGLGPLKLIELARAAAGAPALILLDEPAVGLTYEETERVAAMLAAWREGGCAILVVEHNVEFISQIADVVYVLDHGKLISSGTVADVKADTRVQQSYFGSLT